MLKVRDHGLDYSALKRVLGCFSFSFLKVANLNLVQEKIFVNVLCFFAFLLFWFRFLRHFLFGRRYWQMEALA